MVVNDCTLLVFCDNCPFCHTPSLSESSELNSTEDSEAEDMSAERVRMRVNFMLNSKEGLEGPRA